MLTTLTHHLLELLVCERVLLLQLVLLDGEGGLQLLHLVHRLPDLLEPHVQVKLLFLQVAALLIVKLHLITEEGEGDGDERCG